MNGRQTNAWLTALLSAIDVGVHAVDVDGITVYYNERAGRLDGLNPSEVIGRHVLEVFPSLSRDTSSLLRVLVSAQTITHRRQSYTNFRGDQVHTTNMTRPVYDGDVLIGALEVATDITEMQHLAERVVDLQAAQHKSGGKGGKSADSHEKAVYTLDDLISVSKAVQEVVAAARKIARTTSPVLIYGETGCGKELLVQGIHAYSQRAQGPFIPQNCAALPGPLLEGILFGTVKGSFTGAENRPGLFELASGGTLFLDELNSMPLDLQAKLLRVLEDGRVRRLGDTKTIPVQVRVMAAMNTDPEAAVADGLLRQDLYYRVRVVALRLPPLRERPEDIPVLVQHFVKLYNARFGSAVRGLDEAAMQHLCTASWPGNVRELKHAIEAAMNTVDGPWITVDDLPAYLHSVERAAPVMEPMSRDEANLSLQTRLEAYERGCLQQALSQTGGNVAQAARLLSVPRQTLQSKMRKYDL